MAYNIAPTISTMMMRGENFLKAVLGDDCVQALTVAVAGVPGLAAAVAPRAMVAWLAANGTSFVGGLPGTAATIEFYKSDEGYRGNVVNDGDRYDFEDMPPLQMVALLSVVAGLDPQEAHPAPAKALVKLGKSIDLMIGTTLRAPGPLAYLRQFDVALEKGIVVRSLKSLPKTSPSVITDVPVRVGHYGGAGPYWRGKSGSTFSFQYMRDLVKPHQHLHNKPLLSQMEGLGGKWSEEFDGGSTPHSLPPSWTDFAKIEPAGQPAPRATAQAPAQPTGPVGATAPKKQTAKQTSSQGSQVPGVTGALKIPHVSKTLKVEKHEAAAACRSCRGSRFAGDRFVGCTCFSSLAKSVSTQVIAGGYMLTFAPSVDPEAFVALATSMRRR